jgi:hypothetical protein
MSGVSCSLLLLATRRERRLSHMYNCELPLLKSLSVNLQGFYCVIDFIILIKADTHQPLRLEVAK